MSVVATKNTAAYNWLVQYMDSGTVIDSWIATNQSTWTDIQEFSAQWLKWNSRSLHHLVSKQLDDKFYQTLLESFTKKYTDPADLVDLVKMVKRGLKDDLKRLIPAGYKPQSTQEDNSEENEDMSTKASPNRTQGVSLAQLNESLGVRPFQSMSAQPVDSLKAAHLNGGFNEINDYSHMDNAMVSIAPSLVKYIHPNALNELYDLLTAATRNIQDGILEGKQFPEMARSIRSCWYIMGHLANGIEGNKLDPQDVLYFKDEKLTKALTKMYTTAYTLNVRADEEGAVEAAVEYMDGFITSINSEKTATLKRTQKSLLTHIASLTMSLANAKVPMQGELRMKTMRALTEHTNNLMEIESQLAELEGPVNETE